MRSSRAVNLLERIDARGRAEPVAANLDRVAAVVACEPLPDWFVVDRYWAGARLKDIEALLIVNKSDVHCEDLAAELANYRNLGLPCVEVSARDRRGPCGAARRARRPAQRCSSVNRAWANPRSSTCSCPMQRRKPPSSRVRWRAVTPRPRRAAIAWRRAARPNRLPR